MKLANKSAIIAGRQAGKSFTNHLARMAAQVEALRVEQEEKVVSQAMREMPFEEFIYWAEVYTNMEFPEKTKAALKVRHEIENSPLAKALREE